MNCTARTRRDSRLGLEPRAVSCAAPGALGGSRSWSLAVVAAPCRPSGHRKGRRPTWPQQNYLGHRDEAIIRLLATTGARLSEVATITLDDVDLSGAYPSVRVMGKARAGEMTPNGIAQIVAERAQKAGITRRWEVAKYRAWCVLTPQLDRGSERENGELERETGFEPATFCLGSRHSAN
jgi:integrase